MSEIVEIDARLVGNNSGKIYSENSMAVKVIFKEPEVYVGDCLLSIPQHPTKPPFPQLDPEDTEIILQFRTNSDNTRFGRSADSPFPFLGHWRGWIDARPRAVVEIPNISEPT